MILLHSLDSGQSIWVGPGWNLVEATFRFIYLGFAGDKLSSKVVDWVTSNQNS